MFGMSIGVYMVSTGMQAILMERMGHHDHGTPRHIFSRRIVHLLFNHHRSARAEHNHEPETLE